MEDAGEKYDNTSLSSLFKKGSLERSSDTGWEYSLQVFIIVLFVIELLAIWLVVSLLLIPVFRYVKPLKDVVVKEHRRYISLLLAILITIIVNSFIGGDGLLHIAASLTKTFLWLLAAILLRDGWQSKNLEVNVNGTQQANILQLVAAFQQGWPTYSGGELLKFAKSQEKYDNTDKVVDLKNGFVRYSEDDPEAESDEYLEACVWNRKNGHSNPS
jgi:hypothetical protein